MEILIKFSFDTFIFDIASFPKGVSPGPPGVSLFTVFKDFLFFLSFTDLSTLFLGFFAFVVLNDFIY